jgi:hypothetical protein
MDRRKFIKSSAGGLAVGVAGPVELGKMVIPNWKNISVDEMNTFIYQQDYALDEIENNEKGGEYLESLLGVRSENKEVRDLFRNTMKTLLLSGNFVALSTEGQMHPKVQKRIWDSANMVNETIEELVSKLKSFSPEDLSGFKALLLDDPEIGIAIEETLAAEAVNAGVPRQRIRRLRRMIRQQLKKLKQSPGMVIEKYVHKYDKLMSRVNSEEENRRYMIANMGEKAFHKKVSEAEQASLRWKEILPPGVYKDLINEDPDSKEKIDPPKGLKALGIGAILTGLGWLLIATGTESGLMIGLVAGVTVGPILMVIAIIVIIVSGIKQQIEKNKSK